MASSTKGHDTVKELRELIGITISLLTKFEDSIHYARFDNPIDLPLDIPNAFGLAGDSFNVLKGSLAKLGLLSINKPFATSALIPIVRQLESEIIPSLMIAAETCPSNRWTNYLHREIRSSVGATFKELIKFMGMLPTKKELEEERSQALLHSIGIMNERCVYILRVAAAGLDEMARLRLAESQALVKDAIEEIEDWRDNGMGSEDEDEGEHSENEEQKTSEKPQEKSQATQLRDSIAHTVATTVLRFLKHLLLIYPPVIKRRIKRFKKVDRNTAEGDLPTPEECAAFDHMLLCCQLFSEVTDDLAGALYEFDLLLATEYQNAAKTLARDLVDRVGSKWEGGEDEFTTWSKKWLSMLEEISITNPP
ncbi:hypothetical protein MMC25_004422 [Agyrium rufum]|nr:hypothetical protein [Agyrium rufum]